MMDKRILGIFGAVGAAVVVVSMCAPSASAQTWSKIYRTDDPTGLGTFQTESILPSSDGGTWALGGYGRTALVKLDPFGNVSWARWIGGPLGYGPALMVETRDGHLMVAGVVPAAWPGYSWNGFWFSKLSPDGSVLWHKRYGTAIDYFGGDPIAVIEMDDGGFLLAGEGRWLAKTDPEGNLLWQKTYLDPDAFRCYWNGVAVLPNGNIVAVGWWAYNTFYDTDDLWVIFLSPQGTILSQRIFGSPDFDPGYFPVVASDGGAVVVGGTTRHMPEYGSARWLLKFDGNGVFQWEKSFAYSSSAFISLTDVIVLGNGDMLFRGSSDYLNPGETERSAVLVRFSPAGDVLWIKSYGLLDFPPWWDRLKVAATPDEEFFISGNIDSSVDPEVPAWLIRTDGSGAVNAQCAVDTFGLPSTLDPQSLVANTNAVATNTGFAAMSYDPMIDAAVVVAEDACIPDTPRVEAVPWPVDFGVVDVDASAVTEVEVRNTGASEMLVSTMAVSPPFVLTTTCAESTVPPAGSCIAELTFDPTSTGTFSGELIVETDDPATPALAVPVLGEGVDIVFESGFESGDTATWSSTKP